MKLLLIFILCLMIAPHCAVRGQSKVQDQKSLFRITVNDKTGYIDRMGNIVIDPQFHSSKDFSEGLAAFEIKMEDHDAIRQRRVLDPSDFETEGYIDQTGKVVIAPKFWNAGDFSEGLAAVVVVDPEDKEYVNYVNPPQNTFFLDGPPSISGYIDASGEYVIEPQFDAAFPFHDGRAFVITKDRRWGYIDKSGQIIIGPFRFPDEYRRVPYDGWSRPLLLLWEFPDDFQDGMARILNGKHLAYIDRSGATVIESNVYAFGSGKFSEGLARIRVGGKYINVFGSVDKFDGKFGFIDRTGKIVIKPQFDIAGEFVDGLAPVAFKNKVDKEIWGFIDATGTMAIQPQFNSASNFSEGLAQVLYGHKWCFIDRAGKIVIETDFSSVDDFQNGLARFRLDFVNESEVTEHDDGRRMKIGYIDMTGKIIWQQVYKL